MRGHPTVVFFGEGAVRGLGVAELGDAGAALDELAALALPVIPGFTIPTDAHPEADGFRGVLGDALQALVARVRGADTDGLVEELLSVRASAAASLPGVPRLSSLVGISRTRAQQLAADDDASALAGYCRLIEQLGRDALGISPERFEDAAFDHTELPARAAAFLRIVDEDTGVPFPDDTLSQLFCVVQSIWDTWRSPRAVSARARGGVDAGVGIAVHVQRRSRASAPGFRHGAVGSRDRASGEKRVAGWVRAGEGVAPADPSADGASLIELRREFPHVARALEDALAMLECHYREPSEVEFEVDDGVLSLRSGGPARDLTSRARIHAAVDLAQAGVITQRDAVLRVSAPDVEALLHSRFADHASQRELTVGLGVSPGAACGRVCLTSADAEALARTGESGILVRPETAPGDLPGMLAAAGIVTARGGRSSHAAVVARGLGKPAVCAVTDVEFDPDGRHVRIAGHELEAGSVIAIDGSSGRVVLGAVSIETPSPSGSLATLLEWADGLRRLAVHANADNAADAAVALRFGAEGIGLCRTEHQFLGERLPLIRRMILAGDEETEREALDRLADAQQEDFGDLLTVMGGRPITVRLLDPPLHEFLPDVVELEVGLARGTLDDAGMELLEAARRWRETNPMLGTRGVRLALIKPGLYPAQARALFAAAAENIRAGGRPVLEVMIPLVVSERELAAVASGIAQAAEHVERDTAIRVRYRLGTMIETPRAALTAASIAREAEFFSFGTNDLTQLTFGFSRDDVEQRTLPRYLDAGVLAENPFATLDRDGVGALMALALAGGRATRPSLRTGLCGEHGGDPASIELCEEMGLDYVSCSPFRVPVARLAAAHAACRTRERTPTTTTRRERGEVGHAS